MKITKEDVFTKEQFLKSNTMKWSKDVIEAVLEDEKSYQKLEAEKKIKNYLEGKRKGEVK
ncbi:MAG TPA: hypothetical protein IAB62_09580 [Candidatus Coprocola pullicola]|nr:hypothetical protein [Candidatus Coprocola pullicola]